MISRYQLEESQQPPQLAHIRESRLGRNHVLKNQIGKGSKLLLQLVTGIRKAPAFEKTNSPVPRDSFDASLLPQLRLASMLEAASSYE